MPIRVTSNRKELQYSFNKYEDNRFVLSNADDDDLYLESPLSLDDSFKEELFDTYFLAKKDVKENDIFQIYDKPCDTRIGWIIPVNSLESAEHSYSNNEHFLKIAYMGVVGLLNALDTNTFSNVVRARTEVIALSDIFHESTVVLIISRKELLDNHISFNLDRAIPSLIKYGYIKLLNRNPREIKFEMDSPTSSKIHIELISEAIENYERISELLTSSFPYDKKPVFSFFFLYQVIELLIGNVFRNEQPHLLDKLNSMRSSSSETRKILQEIQEVNKEKTRLRLLVDNYCVGINSELYNLRSTCNTLLKVLNRDDDGNELNKYLYSVRNFVFHQYIDFPSEAEPLLDDVVKNILDILPSLLTKYRNP